MTALALVTTACGAGPASDTGTVGGASSAGRAADGASGSAASGSDTSTTGDNAAPDSAAPDSAAPDSASPGESAARTAAAPSGEQGAAPSAASSDDADDAVDALSLTGPVSVPDVPDMTPIVTDPHPSFPVTVTDSRGKSVTIASADRVIALDLYGTLTDTIIALGLQDRLVGRGVSDTQEVLKDLPVVSLGGIDLNVEAVLDLKPDLILTNMTIGSAERYQQLEAAGVTVLRFDQVPSIAHIPDEIRQVGAAFGMKDQSEAVVDYTEQHLTQARREIAELRSATPRQPRAIVAYVRGSAGLFFILGADYGAADVLRELGLEDVASENGIKNLTPANAESLVKLDPEIVLTMKAGVKSAGGVDAFLQRPGMSATTAGQHHRVITAADSQLLSYGPRTPASLVGLARAIYTAHAS